MIYNVTSDKISGIQCSNQCQYPSTKAPRHLYTISHIQLWGFVCLFACMLVFGPQQVLGAYPNFVLIRNHSWQDLGGHLWHQGLIQGQLNAKQVPLCHGSSGGQIGRYLQLLGLTTGDWHPGVDMEALIRDIRAETKNPLSKGVFSCVKCFHSSCFNWFSCQPWELDMGF